jgi:hypothetical protein
VVGEKWLLLLLLLDSPEEETLSVVAITAVASPPGSALCILKKQRLHMSCKNSKYRNRWFWYPSTFRKTETVAMPVLLLALLAAPMSSACARDWYVPRRELSSTASQQNSFSKLESRVKVKLHFITTRS